MIVYSYYIHATSGYTGHEHLPYFGLINMNARLYDPVLGRFLGPDPYVQNPLLSQNFNRYSYALNNPLRYMDESGEFIWGIVAVGAFIIGKLYYDGYKANGNEFNPFKWDWGNANYSVGYSSTSGAYGGVGWNNSYGVSGAYNFSQQTPTWGYTYNGTPYMAPMRPYTGGNAVIAATNRAILAARSINYMTPFDVGLEWLTGTGPTSRTFYDDDYFTGLLKQHNHISNVRSSIPSFISSGKLEGESDYSLSGISGIKKYAIDYSTLSTMGLTGNLAVTYLGSYSLNWKVLERSKNTANIQFSVTNSTTIQSGIRPPVIGYYPFWKNTVGSWVNEMFSTGYMSPKYQTFIWTETIKW